MVTYLASPLCRFTGRILGIVGDDLTLWNGWTVTVTSTIARSRPPTVQALHAALQDVALQQSGMGQAIKGVNENLTPPEAVLEALAAVEKA